MVEVMEEEGDGRGERRPVIKHLGDGELGLGFVWMVG